MGRGRGQSEGGLRGQEPRGGGGEQMARRMQYLINQDQAARNLAKAFAGDDLYVVGGAVRDLLFGRDPKDIDMLICGISADSVNRRLKQLPGKVDYTGKSFGVFRYRYRGDEVEVALPRKERSTGTGYRDFEIIADPELRVEEDLWRRDYTVNAMAWHAHDNKLIDPYGGSLDAHAKLLRPVREEALQEDPLRILRGAVLLARYDLHADDVVKKQLQDNRGLIHDLANERIGEEMRKLLKAPYYNQGIQLINELNLLDSLPGLPTLELIDDPQLDQDLRFTALFKNAPSKGLSKSLRKAFLLTNDELDIISGALSARDNQPNADVDETTLRRYISGYGRDHTMNWAKIHRDPHWIKRLEEQMENPLVIKDLAIAGAELMDLGYPEGPEMGKALRALLDKVLENPGENTPDRLSEHALKLLEH